MAKQYNLRNIRALLMEGFTDEELRILCFDVSAFNPVYSQLTKGTGKTKIVQHLLKYVEQKELIETLLDQAKKSNLAKYKKYYPYDEVTISSEVHGKSQRAPNITSKEKKTMTPLVDLFAVPVVLKAVDFLFGVTKEVMDQRRMTRENGRTDLLSPPEIPLLKKDRDAVLQQQVSEQFVEQKRRKILHLLEVLEAYEKNRQRLEQQAIMHGGRKAAPLIVTNLLDEQEDAILKHSKELADLLDDLIGRKA